MVLFDQLIKDVLQLFNEQDKKELDITSDLIEDVGKNNMIFGSETAYELGGGMHKTLCFDLSTSTGFISEDTLYLIGKDLNEISQDEDFMRITLLEVNDDKLEGNALYDRLEKIKLTKYRVSPKGYMLRTSTGDHEKVRISKDFIQEGNFSEIGSAYLKVYHQMPFVKNVQIFFITGDSPLYSKLKDISTKKKDIVDTIDHILKGMLINDCNACSVKELCDEVEGLREIHKGK